MLNFPRKSSEANGNRSVLHRYLSYSHLSVALVKSLALKLAFSTLLHNLFPLKHTNFRLSKRASVDSAIPEKDLVKSPPLSERIPRGSADKENEPSAVSLSVKRKETRNAVSKPNNTRKRVFQTELNSLAGFVKERINVKSRLRSKFNYEGNLYRCVSFFLLCRTRWRDSPVRLFSLCVTFRRFFSIRPPVSKP